jgi:hypothetical protein
MRRTTGVESRLIGSEDPGTTFDWFLTPNYLLPFLEELTSEEAGAQGKASKSLMLGCGNSALGEGVRPSEIMTASANEVDVRCWLARYRQYRRKLPPLRLTRANGAVLKEGDRGYEGTSYQSGEDAMARDGHSGSSIRG